MTNYAHRLFPLLILTALAGCASSGPPPVAEPEAPERPSAEIVAAWNGRVLGLAEAEDGFLTLKGLRTAAMMHLAMHDALAIIEGRYEPYLAEGPAAVWSPSAPLPPGEALAAVAQAGYEVASDQYPDQEETLKADLDRWLAEARKGTADQAVEEGRAVGKATAYAIRKARHGDGWDGEAEYQWHPMGPGVYAEFNEHSGTPEGFIFGAGWAKARPFFLESPSHFRSPPPPAIESDIYTEAFNEVKELGRHESTKRTADQAHLALWWKDFVENSHNRLARRLAVEEGLDLVDGARLFALLEGSIYDAYVNVFDNKFHYNHWRPYTAIRWAEHDGNPDTVADLEWNNLHRHTYAFPSYPSAHGTACAAAMTVMEEVFGADRPVTIRTEQVDKAGPFSGKIAMDPPTRSFDSFADAAWECSLSRVYLGIHFRYDSTEGNALGKRIGRVGVEGYLRPVKGEKGSAG